MNPVATRPSSTYYYEHDHGEAFSRLTSAITLFDPIKITVGYLVPWIAAWASNQIELREDDQVQERLLSSELKDVVFEVIKKLKAAAEINRDISLYTSLNYSCSSYGGSCSLTAPVLSIPLYFLTKEALSQFEDVEVENPTRVPSDYWRFSSDEVIFFIAREMARIKSNDTILHIASKIVFLSAIFFYFSLAVPIFISASLILGCGILLMVFERVLDGRLDSVAVNILTKYFQGDEERAVRAATGALQKLIHQNIERKEKKSWWNGFYLSKSGNNLLEIDRPLLTSRLQNLQEKFTT